MKRPNYPPQREIDWGQKIRMSRGPEEQTVGDEHGSEVKKKCCL